VAIIGAGPYGLSLAAHLAAAGVNFRIFGRPMGLWRDHMPENMMLKSNGYASNLSAPDGAASSLKSFCRLHGLEYGDLNVPVPRSTFVAYADWFRARHVPMLEEQMVTGLDRSGDAYLLTLENGERVTAAQVVLAVGITAFAHTPAALASLPSHLASHSFDHVTVGQFAGKDVVVVGAGASAVNLAYELREAGARTSLLVRGPLVEYHEPPNPKALSPWQLLTNPPAPFGQGWRSLLPARLPSLFYRLPEKWRARSIRSHMKPAAGWFMRDKVMGLVPELLGRSITGAVAADGKVQLSLSTGEILSCDHVIAATGYRMDLNRLSFLAPRLARAIARPGKVLEVTPSFETDLEGLYALGPLAMENFGPLLRFVCGASFAAPRLARILRRRVLLKRAEAFVTQAAHSLAQRVQNAFA
jgi:thioredoxin reductase